MFLRKKHERILDDLGPLYHEYSFFGVCNEQLPGNYAANQKAKAPIITAYIAYAIAKSQKGMSDEVSFMELFCADGYYAMVSRRLGATKCYGVDNNRDAFFSRANEIAARLKIDHVYFINQDANDMSPLPKVDIVANVGGLYHVRDPKEILLQSYHLARKYLIVQTVVSLANHSDTYFETPAPGWSWGSRYSKESFDKMIRSLDFKMIDSHFNELEGNERLEDRGSLYYLIEK